MRISERKISYGGKGNYFLFSKEITTRHIKRGNKELKTRVIPKLLNEKPDVIK